MNLFSSVMRKNLAFWGVALLAVASVALLAVACGNETTNDPPADEPMEVEITSGFNEIDVSTHTANLPFEVISYWSAHQYFDELLLGAIRDAIVNTTQNTISRFGSDVDFATQNVIMVDMLVSAPASGDLRLIANLENSQFMLTDGDGTQYTTATWVEAPNEADALNDVNFFIPFKDFFRQSGASFLQGIDIVEDLTIHGYNETSNEFFEDPLEVEAGEELQVWLAYIVPMDAENFSLQFDNTTIPLSTAPRR